MCITGYSKVTDKNQVISRINTSKILNDKNEIIAFKEDNLCKMVNYVKKSNNEICVNIISENKQQQAQKEK